MDQNQTRGPLLIYYGTMGGTSTGLSYQLAQEAKDHHFNPSVINVSEFNEEQLSIAKLAIFVISTFGCGGPTSDAEEFLKWMQSTSQTFPNLKFTVFALGSHFMEHFCKMGVVTDETFSRLGAHRIHPLGKGDSADNQTHVQFDQWKTTLWQPLEQEFPLVDAGKQELVITPLLVQKCPKPQVETIPKPENYKLKQYLSALQLKVKEIKELRKNASFGNSTLYLELESSGLKYQTAGNIAIYPENSKKNIAQICQLLELVEEDYFEIIQNPQLEGRVLKHPFPTPTKVGDYLKSFCDFLGKISKRQLYELSKFCIDAGQRSELEHLSSQGGSEDYEKKFVKERLNLLDLLQHYKFKGITLSSLFELCPTIAPRFYTISSSFALNPNNIQLVISQLVLKANQVNHQLGLASQYFSDLCAQQTDKNIKCYLVNSSFAMPKNPDVSLLLTSPGAGLAPMRALIQEKKNLQESPIRGSITLYFGCRTKNDFIFEEEFKLYESSGALNKLVVVFSRDGEKKYIQDIIKEDLVGLRDHLVTSKGCLYMCGSTEFGKGMQICVEKMFVDVQKTMSFLVFSAINDLEKGGQIIKEIWGFAVMGAAQNGSWQNQPSSQKLQRESQSYSKTAVKIKLVTSYIINNIADNEDQSSKIFKLLEGSGFTQVEINSTISCITFILENSAKYDISDAILTKELIDLGLPKENCEYLSKTFKQSKEKLQMTYGKQIMKNCQVGECIEIKTGLSQFIVSDSVAPMRMVYGNQFVDVSLKTKDINGNMDLSRFVLFPEKLNDLIASLQKAQKIMQNY